MDHFLGCQSAIGISTFQNKLSFGATSNSKKAQNPIYMKESDINVVLLYKF